MSALAIMLAALALVPALADWRLAVLMTLGAGFLQDVLRKLTPGEPVYMVLLFAPVFAAAAAGLLMRGGTLGPQPMYALHPSLRAPVSVFFFVVALQVLVTLGHTGSVALAGIGVLVYALPFAGLVIAMYYAATVADIVRAFSVYVAFALLFSAGVYLNVMGYRDGVLDSVGVGLLVYPETGGVLELPPGFFRSAETAAWHGATAAAVTAILVLARAFPAGTVAGLALIAVLIGAVVLTGRRKMVVELVLFVPVYAALLTWYRGRAGRLAGLLAAAALVAFVLQLALVPEREDSPVGGYVSRYRGVTDEAAERLRSSTVGSFRHVVNRNGLLGAGAGTASQGAAAFGGGPQLVGFAAEGGLAKVLAELGVHGLAATAWLAAAMLLAAHAAIRRLLAAGEEQRAVIAAGLLALLLCNLAVFATASQVFGDPFVLLVLGLCLGFVLRAPPPPRPSATAA